MTWRTSSAIQNLRWCCAPVQFALSGADGKRWMCALALHLRPAQGRRCARVDTHLGARHRRCGRSMQRCADACEGRECECDVLYARAEVARVSHRIASIPGPAQPTAPSAIPLQDSLFRLTVALDAACASCIASWRACACRQMGVAEGLTSLTHLQNVLHLLQAASPIAQPSPWVGMLGGARAMP